MTDELALARLQRAAIHYDITARHLSDAAGPEYTAVLKPRAHHTGHARLICTGSVSELGEAITAQGRLPLPQRAARTDAPDPVPAA